METLTDELLIAHVAVGETRALGVLIRRYRGRVYGILLRATGRAADAEDLFQETWIRVGQRARSFDPARPFAPWLATVATRLAIDWSRSPNRDVPADDSGSAADAPSSKPNPEQEIATAQDRRHVARALEALPEAMRQAVLLRYFDELTEQEVSSQLAIPLGTVKSRVHHGLRALREALRGEAP